MILLTTKRLTLSFESPLCTSLQVLKDIELTVREKESIGITGPSGAGKTQLGYAIGRLNEYFGGRIQCEELSYHRDGEDWNLMEEQRITAFRRTEIGYIFQEPFLYFNPTLRIKNQLALSASSGSTNLAGMANWLARVGLQEQDRILASFPHQLSGGQLQRLAIAGCLMKNPRIIIADEITSSLDQDAAQGILELILQLKNELGFSMLWVTHDEAEAVKYCDRIWSMRDGRLLSDQPAAAFKARTYSLKREKSVQAKAKEILKLTGIRKKYPQAGTANAGGEVLRGISFSLYEGEISGLAGDSGSGKSTLGRILAGMESWDQGQIRFDGRDLKQGFRPSREILYLFQDAFSSINPKITVKSLLDEALTAGGNQMDQEFILQLTRLDTTILTRKAGELSGGLRQRFALARALASMPRILIMDESVNALDVSLQEEILGMLLGYRKKYRLTILFISHQLKVVNYFCDRIFLLKEGKLEEKPGIS